jgi:hypothetical protein
MMTMFCCDSTGFRGKVKDILDHTSYSMHDQKIRREQKIYREAIDLLLLLLGCIGWPFVVFKEMLKLF